MRLIQSTSATRPTLGVRTSDHCRDPCACAEESAVALPMVQDRCVDIIGFLEHRIAEDEQLAREAMRTLPVEDSRLSLTGDHRVTATGWRTLGEAALKRDMLFTHHDIPHGLADRSQSSARPCQEPYPCQQLRIALAVYADHPRYDPAWKPHDPDTRADRPRRPLMPRSARADERTDGGVGR